MAVYRRGEVWWIRFTGPNGERVRKSSGTSDKRAAQELHDRLKAEAWRTRTLGDKPKYTWDDAVVQWFKEKDHKSSIEKDKEIFRWADPFLRGLRLELIDRTLLFKILEAKASETSKATANRYMALIRALLRRACEVWEWIERVPKAPMYQVESRRVRWATPEEADRVLAELPPHQRAMMLFSLATGIRQRNVCRLEWSQVDMTRQCAWIHPDQAKNKSALAVPLNRDAMLVLQELVGQHPQYVFTFEGQPVWQVSTKAWRKALQRAGIENFRWHDLRHTWASRHAQSGTPLHVLQELGGWKSMEMVRRYAHLSTSHLLEHAQRIATC